MSSLWLNVVASGLLMGVVYGLIALGLTLVFGVMRVVNFAHGEMVVIGAYIGYWSTTLLGTSVLVSAIIAAIVMLSAGYALERLMIDRFVSSPHHVQFIVFIGLALLITGAHLVAFGPDPRPSVSAMSFEVLQLGPLRLDYLRLQAAGAAAAMILGLSAYLHLSTFGRSVRAAADNRLGGLVVGLNIPRVFAVTFAIGCAYAGAAGALISPLFDVHPYLAVDFTLLAFVTVIVGGLGSFLGAIAAGLLIGVTESVSALLFSPSLKSAFSYVLLVVVMLVRPKGLFGS